MSSKPFRAATRQALSSAPVVFRWPNRVRGAKIAAAAAHAR